MTPPWKLIIDLASLPRPQTEESEFLEYKREPWDNGEKGYNELARDVAQFANHLGGSIIVGAAEDRQDRLADYLAVSNPAGVVERVTDVCHSALSPRVQLQVNVVAIAEDHQVVVVNVSPHDGVVANKLKGIDRWEFYRRIGKGRKHISFEEVERMWSDGRKGRLLLAQIPQTQLTNISIDAHEGPGVELRGPFQLGKYDTHFIIGGALPGPTFSLPYEAVNAVWPASGGGWSVSLSAYFTLNPHGQIRVRYLKR